MQPQFLHEIERTMSVIAFKNPSDSPLGHLLEQAQRRRVADEVNSAILRSQKQELGKEVDMCAAVYDAVLIEHVFFCRADATHHGPAVPLYGRSARDQAKPPFARHSCRRLSALSER